MEEQKKQANVQEEIREELLRLKKVLKQSSKNELIAILMNTLMQLADMRNANQVLLEENRGLKPSSQDGEENV